MITIRINNNKFQVDGPRKLVMELYDQLSIRHPNAYFLRPYMPKGWDGRIHYMSEYGYVETGLFPYVAGLLKEMKVEFTVEDHRGLDKKKVKIPKKLGKLELRDYQLRNVGAVINNQVGGIWFPRGVLKVATNGGKTTISAAIHKAFNNKTILLLNSTELFSQGREEWEELLPGEVGYIGDGKVKLNQFTIAMVKTVLNRIDELKPKLASFQTVIVDECDLADNKTYKEVLKAFFNAPIRVGLTGTIFMSPLKKDLVKNMNLKKTFGELLDEVTNRELIDAGHSSKVKVKFIRGNTDKIPSDLDYRDAYTEFIVKNKKRNARIVKRVVSKYLKGRKPILIIAQRQAHIKRIFKRLKKALPGAKIDWVHHDRKDRKAIVDNFKFGHIEILVGSMILKRGKNFPLMQYMLNAAGGKNPEGPIQLLGRAMRKHISKTHTEYEDMWDEGNPFKSHSRRRYAYYKKEDIPVTNKYS